MFLYALFHRRELHIVAKEMAEIFVVLLRQRHLGVLKLEHPSLAKPLFRKHFLKTVGTSIYLHVACLVVVVEMAQRVHLPNKMPAYCAAEEVGCCLYGKSSPFLWVCKQRHVLAEGVVGRNSVQTVNYLRISRLQSLCFFNIIVSSIKREDVNIKSYDTRNLPILDKGSGLVGQF